MKRIIPSYKNLADILQDAIDQEHDASQYYAEAAQLAQDQDVKDFLIDLAKMEEDHHRMLKEKLESLKADQRIMDGILSSYGESEQDPTSNYKRISFICPLSRIFTGKWAVYYILASMKLVKSSVLVILPHRQFNDTEFLTVTKSLEAEGCRIHYAAASLQPAIGTSGTTVRPQLLFSDIDASAFDAAIFVGGPGARDFWAHPRAHNLVRAMDSRGKVIAAICLAPVILANAGVLKDREATCHPTARREMEAAGVRYVPQPVVETGRIITASSPEAAEAFAFALVQKLSSTE